MWNFIKKLFSKKEVGETINEDYAREFWDIKRGQETPEPESVNETDPSYKMGYRAGYKKGWAGRQTSFIGMNELMKFRDGIDAEKLDEHKKWFLDGYNARQIELEDTVMSKKQVKKDELL